jgi:CheY-like chemotaxis protein
MSNTVSNHRVLVVDDEPHILAATNRNLGRQFNLTCAGSGQEALQVMENNGPFSVVLSDMRMPGMTGLEFIKTARKRFSETVYLMLTGNADQQTAVDAINQGRIFRFLCKPCPPEVIADAVRAATVQFDLVTAERVLLKETLTGSVRLMVEALELSDPHLGALQSSVKQWVPLICKSVQVPVDWQLAVASSVCLIGLVADGRTGDSLTLTPEALGQAGAISSKLVRNIPRMEGVGALLARQSEPGDMPGALTVQDRESRETINARVLRIAIDLAITQRQLGSRSRAVAQVTREAKHDARLIAALRGLSQEAEQEDATDSIREIDASSVRMGMILVKDLLRTDGRCLLAGGQALSELAAASIRAQARAGTISPTLLIRPAA